MSSSNGNSNMDQRPTNRVFVNPNFNRQTAAPMVHFNPAFTNQSVLQKSKIFVNPNFMRNNSKHILSSMPLHHDGNLHNMNQSGMSTLHVKPASIMEAVTKSRYSLVVHKPSVTGTNEQSNASANKILNSSENTMLPETSTSTSYSQSRYSLVRNKTENTVTKLNKTETISLSKYKSVRVNDIKKRLECVNSSGIAKAVHNKKNNVYKFVKRKPTESFIRNVLSPVLNKSFNFKRTSVSPLKLKLNKYARPNSGKLKKNNIPCPLFKKYGKCLRQERGGCVFLHDKKHVSICRNFLKGMCFNDCCLFSHDLTTKKMPTCHFYLNGVCSKENCPYLHVKVSEDAAVCPDFLKGYCEKGDQCLKRHVDNVNKKVKTRKRQSATNIKRSSNISNSTNTKSEADKMKESNLEKDGNEVEAEDRRYYLGSAELGESADAGDIKPTRCKIGTLPSYIRL